MRKKKELFRIWKQSWTQEYRKNIVKQKKMRREQYIRIWIKNSGGGEEG